MLTDLEMLNRDGRIDTNIDNIDNHAGIEILCKMIDTQDFFSFPHTLIAAHVDSLMFILFLREVLLLYFGLSALYLRRLCLKLCCVIFLLFS